MNFDERDARIRELATDDFLCRLVEIARLHGWSSDYTEIQSFLQDILRVAGRDVGDLSPYEIDD